MSKNVYTIVRPFGTCPEVAANSFTDQTTIRVEREAMLTRMSLANQAHKLQN